MKRLAWCLLYGFAGLAQAAINDFTFHGTLVSPPACTISDGKTIEVEFRNVIIDNINGDNFRQDVPYTITCDPDVRDDAWEMSLTWTGSQTPYDDSAIETDVSGLGIELQQNGQPFKLGTPLKIDPSTPPTLQAVPVKANDAALSDGTFSAYATLQVDYQ
ncbi:fimbrial protein [Escherichia coli]|uniref:fimbrial protein n=1 Tax=Escherichia coli TaxID=562 RepID=UPI0011CC6EA5|nr:fimbrial protein [Escherichia coli]